MRFKIFCHPLNFGFNAFGIEHISLLPDFLVFVEHRR